MPTNKEIKKFEKTTNMIEGLYNNILLNLDGLKDILGSNIDDKEIKLIKKEFKNVFENTKNNNTKSNETRTLAIKDTLELFDNINMFLNSASKPGETNKLRDLLVTEFKSSKTKDIKILLSVFNKTSAFDKHIGQVKNPELYKATSKTTKTIKQTKPKGDKK